MALERFKLNELIGLIGIQLFNGIHTVSSSLNTGSSSVVGYTNIYGDDDFCIRISELVLHHLFPIAGTPNAAVANILKLDYAENVKIILSGYWKFHSLKGERNGEKITSMATTICYCTTSTRHLSDINLLPNFLLSEIACDASNLINTFTEHDRKWLNNCNMEHDSYQDIYWYLECISLSDTEDSQTFNVWKVNNGTKVMKFMFFMTDQSGNEHKWVQTIVSLSGKEFISFPDSTGRYIQSSILSNGYQKIFFKRNKIKVCLMSQTIDINWLVT